jgi:hypothetical protein
MSLTKLCLTGIIKLFPARESLVIDIPAEDRKIDNLFLQCTMAAQAAPQLLPSVFLPLTRPANESLPVYTWYYFDDGSCEKKFCKEKKV